MASTTESEVQVGEAAFVLPRQSHFLLEIIHTQGDMMDTDSMIDALQARGPHPDLAEHLMLFGQFVGAWDVDVTNIAAESQAPHTSSITATAGPPEYRAAF